MREAFNKTVRDPAFIAEAERLVLEPELVDSAMIEGVLGRIHAAARAMTRKG